MALHGDRPVIASLLVALAVLLASAAAVGAHAPADGTTQSSGNVTVLAVNGSVAADIADHGDARALRANDTLDAVGDDDPVVAGDTLVIRIRSERMNDAFAATDGANATERFFRATAGSETNVTVRAIVGPSRQEYELSLERSDARVVRDGANATLYAVVDTTDVVFTDRYSGERLAYEPNFDEFSVEVEATGADGTETLEDRFEYVGPDATVRSTTDGLRFAGGGPARVYANASTLGLSGYTNLLPETNVTVRAEAPNGTTLATDRVTTTENASGDADREDARSDFAAALRGVPADEYRWFRLRATGQNATIWERRVLVGPEPRWSNLSATAVETDGDDWTLRIDASLRLPDEGILGLELRTADDHYTREVALPEGRSHQQVFVRNLRSAPEWPVEIEVYWDSAGDGERVFPEDPTFGTAANVTTDPDNDLYARLPVDGTADLQSTPVGTPTGTTTATPTGTTIATPAASPTETATDAVSPTDETREAGMTAADGSGFGAVAALVAITAGIAVAVRRR